MSRWWLALICVGACTTERTRADAEPATGIHPAGIADPTSADFHGREVARIGYDLAACARCHGEAFDGGIANVSCLTCHAEGPTACVTCHGAGPTTGAHEVHRVAGQVACLACHVVPTTWDAEGHLDPAPAEVVFGAAAGWTLAPADRAGPPAFVDGGCQNVYCHGAVLHAGGGLATAPRWAPAAATGSCVNCHAAPPPSHADGTCASCHPRDAHIDGVVQVGEACHGCHGDASSSAPPRDLSGATITTALGVGAHRAHLEAPSRLSGAIACTTCHVVPTTVSSVGHIDSALPAEVTGSLGWSRITADCATSGCHGASRPVWTATDGVFCGSCHGVPPTTPSHTSGMPLTACTTCHPRTIDATGTIIIQPGPTGPVSEHVDGDVDLL